MTFKKGVKRLSVCQKDESMVMGALMSFLRMKLNGHTVYGRGTNPLTLGEKKYF